MYSFLLDCIGAGRRVLALLIAGDERARLETWHCLHSCSRWCLIDHDWWPPRSINLKDEYASVLTIVAYITIRTKHRKLEHTHLQLQVHVVQACVLSLSTLECRALESESKLRKKRFCTGAHGELARVQSPVHARFTTNSLRPRSSEAGVACRFDSSAIADFDHIYVCTF